MTDLPAGYILTSLHKIRVQLYTVCYQLQREDKERMAQRIGTAYAIMVGGKNIDNI